MRSYDKKEADGSQRPAAQAGGDISKPGCFRDPEGENRRAPRGMGQAASTGPRIETGGPAGRLARRQQTGPPQQLGGTRTAGEPPERLGNRLVGNADTLGDETVRVAKVTKPSRAWRYPLVHRRPLDATKGSLPGYASAGANAIVAGPNLKTAFGRGGLSHDSAHAARLGPHGPAQGRSGVTARSQPAGPTASGPVARAQQRQLA